MSPDDVRRHRSRSGVTKEFGTAGAVATIMLAITSS